jgi:AmmeMemoRadiSam system protein B
MDKIPYNARSIMKHGPIRALNTLWATVFSVAVFFAGCNLDPPDALAEAGRTFGPVGSGFWYPGSEEDLKAMVDTYLEEADIVWQAGRIRAVIAPHAGFRYSGRCAAYAFKPLKEQNVDRVIVLAPTHRVRFRGLAALEADAYATPLGPIPIDREAVGRLLDEKRIQSMTGAFQREHALENMLPFLQRTVGTFRLVPLVAGQLALEDYEPLANSIKGILDERTVLVVSSDFTHYGDAFGYKPFPVDRETRKNLEKLDGEAIECIKHLDFVGFGEYLAETGATICGRTPIRLLLKILPAGTKGELARYYTSGDAAGDYHTSVSYAAILFHE